MREILVKNHFGHKKGTRWRGHEIQRIEAFTDAVFAFAITLLAVSLEVPKSFDELLETMKGFVGFAITFTFLFSIWYRHYNYFRKYGIDDKTTLMLNGALLFAVLFFIYPFKLLSYIIVTLFFSYSDAAIHKIINIQKMPELLSLYFFGLGLMLGLFGAMYRHALRYRLHLELNSEEIEEAMRQYVLGIISALGFSIAIGLSFLLPFNIAGFAVFPLLLLQLINRRFIKKTPYAHWLMPAAQPIPFQTELLTT